MTVNRRPPPAGRNTAPAGKAPVSSGIRGSAGLVKMREVQEEQESRREASQMNAGMPFRFFCEAGGATKEIIIVDYHLEEVFWRFEHNMKDKRSGKWNIFTACINENANCPACKEADRPSYYAMYLTIIDLTPYTNKDGIEVPWSKKLLVVKSAQQKKITRLADRHDGNLRGMILAMTRDGDKDASIGNDIEFVEYMDEDALATYETSYEYESQGKRHTKQVIGHEPFDYDALFPMPTEQQLRAIVGGRPEPGSREDNEGAQRSSRPAPGARTARRGDDWEDAAPAPAPARRAPAKPAARTIGEDAPDDSPDVGAEEEAPAQPARRAPVVRKPVAHKPPVEEIEEAEEEAAPPPRRAAPPQRPAARPAARAARPDPEAEEEAQDPPQRGAATSLAERRKALRR